jgi:hypothetical protein
LGSLWGSIGATHVDSDEKLCPQYLLRTDDMEYHIRPLDHKHPIILPVGQEGEFKISKDVMELRVVDGDRKRRRYQVVAMKPIDHPATSEAEGTKPTDDGYADKSLADKTKPQDSRRAHFSPKVILSDGGTVCVLQTMRELLRAGAKRSGLL